MGNPADARVYGPHELRPVENPGYQTAVENALRGADGNALVHADPRTNDYGSLVNDGGPSVPGRSNNCLDCSLSALSSFLGDPTVSAPRHPDRLPDGTIDGGSGERSGLRRAEDWLGGGMLEFQGRSIADQFDALHQYVNNLGPGSAALVHNGWHAFDRNTNSFQYHPDGSPVTNGSHATVVVYPEGASGPVWWDPQSGLTSDQPPSWMTDRSTFLHFTPIDPNQGEHHGGSGNQGTGTGVSGSDVADRDVSRGTVPERVGMHEGPEPGADRGGRGTGVGEAGDRLTDGDHLRVPELVGDDGGRGVHGVQTDGRQPGGPSDLPPSVEHHDPPDSGGRADDRLPADGAVADRSPGTDPTASPDHPQAHLQNGSDGLAVDRGDVARGVGEQSEPGSVAGSGHQPGITGDHSYRHAVDPWSDREPPAADRAADGGRSNDDTSSAQADDEPPSGHGPSHDDRPDYHASDESRNTPPNGSDAPVDGKSDHGHAPREGDDGNSHHIDDEHAHHPGDASVDVAEAPSAHASSHPGEDASLAADEPLFDASGAGYPDSYPLPSEQALTPPHNGAVFWSGRDTEGMGIGPESTGGDGSATRIADSHNGTTLEGLLERNGVEPPKWSPGDPAAQQWWSDVSDIYARNVSGEVRAVVGSVLRPGNIWETIELPRLMENPNVTKIVVIDPATGVERVIFEI